MRADLKSQTAAELQAQFRLWGQPAYRVTQLLEWLYVHRATAWEAMKNLPVALRAQLQAQYALSTLELIRRQGSPDTTQKFLWRLDDQALIESVLIPANPALYGEPSDRLTLCVSTQVGCAYGCAFCASGLAGWKRNLRVEEIVDQVLAVERWHVAGGGTVLRPQSTVHNLQSTVLSQQSTVASLGSGFRSTHHASCITPPPALSATW